MKQDRELAEATADVVQVKVVMIVATSMALTLCIVMLVDEYFNYGFRASYEMVGSSILLPALLAFLIKLLGSIHEDIVS